MPLSHEQYTLIFDEISEGKSLRSALKKAKTGFSQFYQGLKDSKAYADQYAHARQCQAESSFEAVLNAVQEVHSGKLDANAGRVVIDTYKWIAARLKPTVYAEKGLLDSSTVNGPTELIVRWGKPRESKDIIAIDNIENQTKALDA
jgi:hypothetical protein